MTHSPILRPAVLRRFAFALAPLLVATPSFAQGFRCQEVMVPMRDGVKLATDVYLPANQGKGPFPVVLERTPYGKGSCANAAAQFFARRGYVALVQDERGRFNSEGSYYWLVDEGWGVRRDGYDSIEWAGTQPWSNGKVGTMGLSFMCFNQYLTAPTRPPHLAAMFCADSVSNGYRDLFYAGGAMHMIMPEWLLTRNEMANNLRTNFPQQRGYRGDVPTWTSWYETKIREGTSFAASMITPMLTDLLKHPYYDDYWRQLAIDEHWSEIDVPIFHYGGWYDRYPHSAVKNFNGIQKLGGPHARTAQKLFIGPWTHTLPEMNNSTVGDLDFGQEAKVDTFALRLRWFDYHLKGIDTGIMKEPRVRIFVMGANRWRDEDQFPPARIVPTDYFFRSGPSGSIESLNDGVLLSQGPGSEKADTFKYDPAHPVPSTGGDLFVQPDGARDHRKADAMSLTYTTAPLDHDVEVTGLPAVEFYASSSGVDTDWVVTICDVHPDGYSQILRENILRARYREGDTKPVFLTPGKVYKYTIEMYPISNLFKQGHRIRLSLTSSSFPKWYPNGNTGRELDQDTPFVVATNVVLHDRDHPSRIILPIVPAAAPMSSGGLDR